MRCWFVPVTRIPATLVCVAKLSLSRTRIETGALSLEYEVPWGNLLWSLRIPNRLATSRDGRIGRGVVHSSSLRGKLLGIVQLDLRAGNSFRGEPRTRSRRIWTLMRPRISLFSHVGLRPLEPVRSICPGTV